MLEAHISPPYVEKLRTQLANQEVNDKDALRNIWLLPPSVHKAFREGHVAVTLGYRQLGDAKSMDEQSPDTTVSDAIQNSHKGSAKIFIHSIS